MGTLRDLISSSLRTLGVLASGETPSSAEQADAIVSFNQMLDSWSLERLLITQSVTETFSLIPSQQTYTIGTGGDFDTARPLVIERASVITDTNGFELPIEIVNQDQWALIGVKNTQSTLPTKLYIEDSYPLKTLNLWPVPSAVKSLVLYSVKPLSNVTDPSATISLPPGYDKMLRYGLAVELAPEYGKQVDTLILAQLSDSKEHIKRMNIKPQLMETEAADLAGRGTFNWYTGE